jgi:hypothetical protein
MGVRCIGIRPIEPSIGARCIEIRPNEVRCSLICAVAGDNVERHSAMQPRRMNFFQFIALFFLKSKNQLDLKVAALEKIRSNTGVTFLAVFVPN